jgi:hypothetical protein
MSPPEVWGPAVWRLFHTLCEKVNENSNSNILQNLFNMIVRICNFLPCPNCANDASIFLSKINISDIKIKVDLKKIIYLFHNYVNYKKGKPLFNYSQLRIYSRYYLTPVINDFISKYQTKGNMNLLTDSFQRGLVIKDFKQFLYKHNIVFLQQLSQPVEIQTSNDNDNDTKNDNDSKNVNDTKKDNEANN